VEFIHRASLAVVASSAEAVLAQRFGIGSERPALVSIFDEDSRDVSEFDREFEREHLSRWISRAVGRHRVAALAQARTLTEARFAAGSCGPDDPHFCLLHSPREGELGKRASSALRSVAQLVARDPIRVFFANSHSMLAAFQVVPGSVVLYRPKRRRYKIFFGDVSSSEELMSFVNGAVNGGAPLPEICLRPFDVTTQLPNEQDGAENMFAHHGSSVEELDHEGFDAILDSERRNAIVAF